MARELDAELQPVLEDVFRRVEGSILTKWVLIAETVGPAGERGVWTRTSEDLQKWESMGLLQMAGEMETRAYRCPGGEGE
jgi:hypothetical protein